MSQLICREETEASGYLGNLIGVCLACIEKANSDTPQGVDEIEKMTKFIESIVLPAKTAAFLCEASQGTLDKLNRVLHIAPGEEHPVEFTFKNKIIIISVDHPDYAKFSEAASDLMKAAELHSLVHMAQLACKGYLEEAAFYLGREEKGPDGLPIITITVKYLAEGSNKFTSRISALRTLLDFPPEKGDDTAVVREAMAQLAESEYLAAKQPAMQGEGPQTFLDDLLNILGAKRLSGDDLARLAYIHAIPAVKALQLRVNEILNEDSLIPSGMLPSMASAHAHAFFEKSGGTAPNPSGKDSSNPNESASAFSPSLELSRDGNYTIARNSSSKIISITAKDGTVILEVKYGADLAGAIESITITDALKKAPSYTME
ncbi:MAG: hypothetical protein Q8N91_04850, partial [Candidatus Omnitrophota bacterium]|nr:hypothetical protein [Candidatus Omnitrophota bacterium]